MTDRRLNKAAMIIMAVLISMMVIVSGIQPAYAQADPSAKEETTKVAQADPDSTKSTDSGSSSKTKKKSTSSSKSKSNSGSSSESSNSDNDSDEDVLDENAFTTQGNARLGDVISDSSTKDFYTIRTENDNTYYLVIDHAGNMDNVYLLSTIDEADLQDFLENGGSSGTVILPEIQTQEETTPTVPETEAAEKEPENNRMSGIISLIIIIAAAITGGVILLRRRSAADNDEEYVSEHMEDDMIPTVNEDEEFPE